MKKILFATTALVATASVAAADVTFSGYGRFGVKYSGSVAEVAAGTATQAQLDAVDDAAIALDDALVAGDGASIVDAFTDLSAAAADVVATETGTPAVASDTLITSRMLLDINASTESDSGVTFGMMVRVRQDEGNTNAFNATRFYAKTGGLELGVGNIWGAIDSMAGLYAGTVGLTGLGFSNVVSNFGDMGYSSTGAGQAGTREAAEIMYSMGDYGFHVSTNGTDTEYTASATMSGWTVAIGGSDTDTAANAEWLATVGGSIGGVTVGLATAEAVNGNSSSTVSAKFDVAAATSVTVFYNDDEANTVDDKSYGLGFSHGLGGGTSLIGGVASVNDQTVADFGVKFNF